MDNGGDSLASTPQTPNFFRKLQLPASCIPPSDENPSQQRVWVIFGATGHIGRSLVGAALAHNDFVTGVGRCFHDSVRDMEDSLRHKPTSNSPSAAQPFLPLLCDVRIRDTVDVVFKTSLERWGRIDIVVNCSGYGIIGACEDQDDFEIRDQFETNFWGTLHIIQLSLPYFRQQEHGRYIIFSSVSGALGVPGLGPYCATKYAVEGLIESMLYETVAFNVRATLVEPGYVRRDDPATSKVSESQGKKGDSLVSFGHFLIKHVSPPYSSPTAPAGHARRTIQWLGEKQPTSAVKSAELVWQLGHCHHPPLRLLLGGFAVESVRERLRGITEEIEDWQDLRFKTDEDEQKEEDSDAEDGDTGKRVEDGEDVEEEDEGHAGTDNDVEMEDPDQVGN